MTIHLQPGTPGGVFALPPSKSLAHRMLICAALAGGKSTVQNVDFSADIAATAAALRQLGADIRAGADGLEVQGVAGRPAAPGTPVDCNESGSTLRFMIPLFALAKEPVRFVGAPRLMARPLGVYGDIFARQGLLFEQDAASLTVCGPLRAGHFVLPGNVSSQFITGLMLALPLLCGESQIEILPPFESASYAEMTRAVLDVFGVRAEWQTQPSPEGGVLCIPGGQKYRPATARVEADWSQAAVPLALAAARGGFCISGLANAPSTQGDRVVLDIVARCGARFDWQGGLLHVQPPAGGLVSPGEVDLADCPDLGPVLCALALFCRGTTRFVNAGRLRIKESDRIAATQQELRKFGGRVSSTADTLSVEGGHPLRPAQDIDSHNDHRIVMAAATVALGGGLAATIHGAEAINKSWPGFFEQLAGIGARVTEEK